MCTGYSYAYTYVTIVVIKKGIDHVSLSLHEKICYMHAYPLQQEVD